MSARRDDPIARTSGLGRRELLRRSACGFGMLAFGALAGAEARAARLRDESAPSPPHFPARARSVIFLYMDGGPSQVDTFDPKPRLAKEAGRPIGLSRVPKTQFADVGGVLPSPWAFSRHGDSGLEVSALFPHVARCADRLCVIRSMTSRFSEHPGANYFLHSGHGLQGRPSLGAWLSYGLGSASRDLPGYVVVNGGLIPPGGVETFGSGFLPARHQASILRPGDRPLANVRPPEGESERRPRKRALLERLDREALPRLGAHDALEAAVANQELAFRMQAAVPELVDLSGESAATRALYGLDDAFEPTATFGRQCLLARRLVERGVRFVELTVPAQAGVDRWDQHQGLRDGHERNARAVDRPTAALLRDLEARGLLDSTLVIWGGEFGRTPMAQGRDGRDHNPYGFTMWLAGGGARGGHVHGATDDYGYFAVEGKLEMHDLHATILHLLGFDHERLTYRWGGRDMRLTDVHGRVEHGLIA